MAEETVNITKTEYEELKKLEKANEELRQMIQFFMEQYQLSRKKQFGSSSEQIKHEGDVNEQLSLLFNEAEVYADVAEPEKEPAQTTVKEHARRKNINNLETLPDNIEVEVIDKTLPEQEKVCAKCGEKLVEIGENIVRRIKLIPAKLIIEETHTHHYVCRNCQEQEGYADIISAKEDAPVIPGSCATAEAIASIATEKFVMHSPLYRQEQQFNAAGIPLSRQTMSNWLLRATEMYFEPLWQRMRQKLIEEEILHGDETPLQVLHEPGKKPQSKSYMWLYRTGKETKCQLVLYDYQENRSAQHPKDFLEGFSGYLHTDGYAGYHSLPPNIQVVGCMAHARRYFFDAAAILKEDVRKNSPAWRGLQYIDSLFEIEKELVDKTPEDRKIIRIEKATPILNSFHDWVSRLKASPKSLLGRAIHYTMDQWPWLVAYLKDGRLEISNNRAERSIKPFVLSRKNFLFANTPRGARSSAIIFSLIETAKDNHLDPYRYLTWVLKTASSMKMNDSNLVDQLLPMNAPEFCHSGK